MRRRVRNGLLGAIGIVLIAAAVWISIRPSNDRDWLPEQAVLPTAEIDGDRLLVRNVRNFRYRSETDYDAAYEDRAYDLRDLEGVWFAVVPFSEGSPAAHTLLSFGFSGGRYLAVSVEARREKGEAYSPWRGFLKRYELMYVVGDERDVLGVRANVRHNDVFLYPVRTSPEAARNLLVSMLRRANELAAVPDFYNTLTTTCTTAIAAHVNTLAPGMIPLSWRVLLPGRSDALAYELGLIETDLSPEEIRGRFRINEKAAQYADDPEFSQKIRR